MAPRRKTPLPFDGYIRISRVGGRAGESFISPDVQRETIERLATFHGLEVGEVVQELDVSGGKPIAERELGRLIRKVEAGESGGLLVWKVSRFSRNLADGAMAADLVREAGGRIIGDDLDSAAPMGRAILGFLLGWAEEERDARKTGWREAQIRAAERGVHPTRTPVGYTRDPEGRLAPDPVAAPAVTKMFRMRAGGASLQDCANVLQEVTGKGWSRSSVRQMFTSQTYLGRIAIGDSIYKESSHPALVDERTWQLSQRDGKRPKHDGSLASQGILAGFIRCAGCGHMLTVSASGPPAARVASYTCRRVRASGVCPAPASGTVDKVDAVVGPGLAARVGSVDLEAAPVELHDAQAAFAAASRELDEFLAAGLISELGPELYRREVARRREAVTTTASAYADALDAQDRLAAADDGSLEARREFARRVIASVTLAKSTRGRWQPIEERLEVVWRDVGVAQA
jgi:site-specific DNA recombinase